MILKLASLDPGRTARVAGTLTAALLDVSWTEWPSSGAAPSSTTVPLADDPATTLTEVNRRVDTDGGTTEMEAEAGRRSVAVITRERGVAVGALATVNWADLAPALTGTLAGTEAAEVRVRTVPTNSISESVTVAPLDGAAPSRVIRPFALLPPTRPAGVTVTDSTDAGFTVTVASSVLSPAVVALMLAVAALATPNVRTWTVTLLCPAGTVTDMKARAEEGPSKGETRAARPMSDVLSVTAVPPAGAGVLRATTAETLLPPTTDAGVSVSVRAGIPELTTGRSGRALPATRMQAAVATKSNRRARRPCSRWSCTISLRFQESTL
ncbi:MAG: hypothetical protein L0271_05500 [Gemmatimonadetes bacterium]|nr:hypothetical protein [Gemmatimonadota bacterium]